MLTMDRSIILASFFWSCFSYSQVMQCAQYGGNYDCVPAVLKYCPSPVFGNLQNCVEDPMTHCTKNWVDRTDEEWAKIGFHAYSNPRFQADNPLQPSSGRCISDRRHLQTGVVSVAQGERLGYPFMDCSLFPTHNVKISDATGLWCAKLLQYIAVNPESSPSPSSCDTVGNPLVINSGSKIQKETDIYPYGISHIIFERTYNNDIKNRSALWFNSYQRTLDIITPEKIIIEAEKSSAYTSKAQACTSGWNELKEQTTDASAQGTVAQYVNDTCQVKRGNTIVRSIPILPNTNSLHFYLRPGSIRLVRENGSTVSFGLSTNNKYRALGDERGQLVAVDNAAPIAWRFTTRSGDIEDYSADGKLLSITATNGTKQELFYDVNTGLLSSVKDSTGRELLFAYTGNQLSSVTVDGNKTTSYAYNSLGLITTVTRPDNTTRIYHYEDTRFPTALTGITDERGKRYATWTYDAQGRAISSEHAGGAEKTLLAFNADGSTTVTNALSKQTIYRFSDIAGARRVTKVEGQPTANCAGANQDYTYTNEGWIASKTDWKGIKTTYQYNTLGQETSRTEAFGTPEARTITTEWHPTLFVRTKVTEPEKETMYNYDANGHLLNQIIHAL